MADHPPRLRLALVSTPRSGNSWFRFLVSRYYGIPEGSSHQLADADWGRLPAEVIHQIHWRRTPDFVARLAAQGFRVVTLARHPLDTLISILHFSWYNPDTANWLLGEAGDESVVRGAMPRSRSFVEYATGPRAAALLAVTCDWWQRPDVVSVRYEDLVREPAAQFDRLAEAFGPPRYGSLAEVLDACSLDNLRRQSTNNHFWKGQPGLWRSLLPAAEAAEIAAALRPVFDRLGYECDPDPRLDAAAADHNWVRLVGQELADSVTRSTVGHRAEVAAWRNEAEACRAAAEARAAEADQARRERDAAMAELARLRAAAGEDGTPSDDRTGVGADRQSGPPAGPLARWVQAGRDRLRLT